MINLNGMAEMSEKKSFKLKMSKPVTQDEFFTIEFYCLFLHVLKISLGQNLLKFKY